MHRNACSVAFPFVLRWCWKNVDKEAYIFANKGKKVKESDFRLKASLRLEHFMF